MSNRNFKLVMIAFIAILCALSMVAIAHGQQLVGNQYFFQEVIVNHNGEDVCFLRESVDCKRWMAWMRKPPRDSDVQIFKPKYYANSNVERIVGKGIIEWLNNRPRISGYYNFTNNPNYDWKKFGGEDYGTYNKERVNIKVYPK